MHNVLDDTIKNEKDVKSCGIYKATGNKFISISYNKLKFFQKYS